MAEKIALAGGDGEGNDDDADLGKQHRPNPIAHATQVAAIRPSGISAYFDWLTVWSKSALLMAQIAELRDHCDGKVDVLNAPARWNPSYRQRLQLFQPQPPALQLLASTSGLYQTYLEPALDLTFDDYYAWKDAGDIVDRCLVKSHHRDQGIRFFKNSRYFAQRWQHSNVLHHYHDKPSKITGELLCVHIEWFLCGHRALHQAGINSVVDLLMFDHHKFWERRLTLRDVDLAKLGRLNSNAVTGSARRSSLHRDACDGYVLWSAARQSAQVAIDRYRHRFPVLSCLPKQPVEHLLPTPAGDTTVYGCAACS
jgi:hypothetical protein